MPLAGPMSQPRVRGESIPGTRPAESCYTRSVAQMQLPINPVDSALKVAGKIETEVTSIEVIHSRTVSPLDTETLAESARRAARVVVAHEANLTDGAGAEIAARFGYLAFDYLRAPIERVAAKNSPIPFAPLWKRKHCRMTTMK
jgi:pyruvate/2-oxoglutarate/acetoin dehydrogenase E1 component